MSDQPFNALFLCTGNSARSILAEAILNRVGEGRFKAISAGSRLKDAVHPYALQLLQGLNYDTTFARSKSWEEFAAPARRRCTSSLRSATVRPMNPARFGRASR